MQITDENLKKIIARNLFAARHLAAMTQRQAMSALYPAKKNTTKYANVNRISEYETGYREISALHLLKLCKKYGVSADYVLGFSCEPDLNEASRTMGHLYTATSEIVQESVDKMTIALTKKCSEFIATQPKHDACNVIDAAKNLISMVRNKQNIEDALRCLNAAIITYEQKQALRIRNFELEIANINDDDADNVKHFMQAKQVKKNNLVEHSQIRFADWHSLEQVE